MMNYATCLLAPWLSQSLHSLASRNWNSTALLVPINQLQSCILPIYKSFYYCFAIFQLSTLASKEKTLKQCPGKTISAWVGSWVLLQMFCLGHLHSLLQGFYDVGLAQSHLLDDNCVGKRTSSPQSFQCLNWRLCPAGLRTNLHLNEKYHPISTTCFHPKLFQWSCTASSPT